MPASSTVRPPLTGSLLRLLAAAVLALAMPAWPQGGAPGDARGSSAAGTGTGQGAANQRVSRSDDEDREMIDDLAHAHLAEVETGRLALDKTQNPQMRRFAQQMVDDHTRAYQELRQLGQARQLTVPDETDFQHKAIATALRLLTGETFDKQYIRQVGISDHRRTVDLLMKMQQSARDPELKAHAGRLLPTVQRHLAMARELDGTLR